MKFDDAVTCLLRAFPGATVDHCTSHGPDNDERPDQHARAGEYAPIFNARQAYAISRARLQRNAELATLRASIIGLVADVGWQRARPVIASVLGHVPNHPRGAWSKHLGKRKATRIIAALRTLPAQGRLELETSATEDR
jgi:hypothetical protein